MTYIFLDEIQYVDNFPKGVDSLYLKEKVDRIQTDSCRAHTGKRYLSGARGYDVYVGKIDTFEVDFVAQNRKGTAYFQVALTARDEKTLERELRPLQAIRDHYPKVLLTMDEDPEAQYDGIRRLNARDWLLGLTDE